jgi:hypothetical protein
VATAHLGRVPVTDAEVLAAAAVYDDPASPQGAQLRSTLAAKNFMAPVDIAAHAAIMNLDYIRKQHIEQERRYMESRGVKDVDTIELEARAPGYVEVYAKAGGINRLKMSAKIDGAREVVEQVAQDKRGVAREVPPTAGSIPEGRMDEGTAVRIGKLIARPPSQGYTRDEAAEMYRYYEANNMLGAMPNTALKALKGD